VLGTGFKIPVLLACGFIPPARPPQLYDELVGHVISAIVCPNQRIWATTASKPCGRKGIFFASGAVFRVCLSRQTRDIGLYGRGSLGNFGSLTATYGPPAVSYGVTRRCVGGADRLGGEVGLKPLPQGEEGACDTPHTEEACFLF
jgi:hypothetical protein